MQLKLSHLSVAALLLCTQVLRADQQVTTTFGLPLKVNVLLEETDCQNAKGPWISLSGSIALGGMNARVDFRNNLKGTHEAEVVASFEAVLLDENTTIQIPKQPVRGGVGGNPHLYLQFTDSDGNETSDEFYLGRCVQGLTVSQDLVQAAAAQVDVHADGCSNHKGPFITLDGDLFLSGLNAKLIFRNNVKGTHTAEEAVEVSLIGDGTDIVLPKQPALGGVGGNPIISIQFLESDGTAIIDPVVLGRCVQI